MRIPKGLNYSLKEVFRLSPAKTPGFGITTDAYWTILCGQPTLPILDHVAHPKGEGGAVTGMLAPLKDAKKDDHQQPLRRGIYAFASTDKKTVLRLMIMPVDEARFSPDPFLQSPLALEFSEEVRLRVGATWHLIQMTFESHDPAVYPSLDLALALAQRIASLTGGVVADPAATSYRLPEEVLQDPRLDPRVDVREHIRVRPTAEGMLTHGMIKFGWPEYLMRDVPDDLVQLAGSFLLTVGQQHLVGNVLSVGDQVNGFTVTHAGGMPPRHELILASSKTWEEALQRGS